MSITQATNYDYLITDLRLHLGDITTPYRYADECLRTALAGSISSLGSWWYNKYLLSEDDLTVSRNTAVQFSAAEPPIILKEDERPIVLKASIIIKTGSLENLSWSLGHWKDWEISYSNVQGGKSKEASIRRDEDELENLLTPPRKQLVSSDKIGLPGFKNNDYESAVDF